MSTLINRKLLKYLSALALLVFSGFLVFFARTPSPTLACVAKCELDITKTVDKAAASVGDELVYTLTFQNKGSANCTGGGVRVEDSVDPNLTYLSETHTPNVSPGYGSFPVYQPSTPRGIIRWNAHTLSPGESGSVTWRGVITLPPSCGNFDVSNEARVTSYEYSNFTTWVTSNLVTTRVNNECPPPAELHTSCAGAPAEVLIGENVDWSSLVSGGTGSYTYSWTGSDDLTGSSATVSRIYSSAGTKEAIVLVTSGDQSTSTSCSVLVNETPPPPPSLSAECSASPASALISVPITYTVSAAGGTGSYTYNWTGTDSLSGSEQTVTKPYGTVGTKTASAVVTSGIETVTASCSANITDVPVSNPLSASCSANPSTVRTGDSTDWSVTASGGTGSYIYHWTGTDGLSGDGQVVSHAYSLVGSKSGTVAVVSGSETVSASCALTVLPPVGCTTNCGGGGGGGGGFNPPTVVLLKSPPVGKVLGAVYLSQIPYTGLGDWYKIALFLIIVGIWSAAVVYFFRAKLWNRGARASSVAGSFGVPRDNFSPSVAAAGFLGQETIEVHGEEPALEYGEPAFAISKEPRNTFVQNKESVMPNLPVGAQSGSAYVTPAPARSDGMLDIIATEAERSRVVISEEGMRLLSEKGGHDAARVLSLVDSVINFSETHFNREDGWILLNKEKVTVALRGVPPLKDIAPDTPRSYVLPRSVQNARFTEPVLSKASPAVNSALFVSWLATGNRERVMGYLKELREQPGGTSLFLQKVVLDLDSVYRSRFDELEERADEQLSNTVSGLSNAELEDLIAVLLSMVDQSYHSPSLGARLALMRASRIKKSQ